MNINVNLFSFLSTKNPSSYLQNLASRTQVAQRIEPNHTSTVKISEEGRKAASLDGGSTTAEISSTTNLRELIKSYDFHNITPRQMANLSGELFKRNEISEEAACSFNGIELNTVSTMNPDKPIDLVAHFQRMLDTVSTAARSDSTLNYAVDYRKQASQALADIISFAQSEREHIS